MVSTPLNQQQIKSTARLQKCCLDMPGGIRIVGQNLVLIFKQNIGQEDHSTRPKHTYQSTLSQSNNLLFHEDGKGHSTGTHTKTNAFLLLDPKNQTCFGWSGKEGPGFCKFHVGAICCFCGHWVSFTPAMAKWQGGNIGPISWKYHMRMGGPRNMLLSVACCPLWVAGTIQSQGRDMG